MSNAQESPDSPDIQETNAAPTLVIPLEPITAGVATAVLDTAEVNAAHLECLLLQDTTRIATPQHVQQALAHYTQRSTQAELLVLLAYIIGLESGYVGEETMVEDLQVLPPNYTYHSKNIIQCTKAAPNFNVDDSGLLYRVVLRVLLDIEPLPRLQFIAIVSGDLLIITLSPSGNSTTDLIGYSVCLPIARYVLAPTSGRPLHARFQNLASLTQQMRDNIFTPMRNQILAQSPLQPYSGLLGLPDELYERILIELTANQQNIVANVCKDLLEFVKYTRSSWSKRAILPQGNTREDAIQLMCN